MLVGSHFKELQIAEGGVSPLKTVTFFNRSSFEDIHICGVLQKSWGKKSPIDAIYQVRISNLGKIADP